MKSFLLPALAAIGIGTVIGYSLAGWLKFLSAVLVR